MIRRIAVTAVSVAVLVSVAPALPAAAATGATLFTVDRMDQVVYLPNGGMQQTPAQTVHPATVAAATPSNGVKLVADGVSATLAPPTGQQFVAGTTFPLAVAQSATHGTYDRVAICYDYGSPYGTGEVSVTAATYDGGALTSLAADVTFTCGNDVTENLRSAVRVDSDAPYALVRAAVAGDEPRVASGGTDAFTVHVENLGTGDATLGTPHLGGTYAASYAITDDGCAGQVLAPGAGCDVDLTFTGTSTGSWGTGWHEGLLWVPVTGYPRATGVPARLGGRVVPMPSLPYTIKLAQAADGVAVYASTHDVATGGTTGYEVARRADAESPWASVGSIPVGTEQYKLLGFVDTTIDPGTSAQYAVRAVGPLGTSAYSTPISTTRPATPPPTGEIDALVIDTEGTHPTPVVWDAADGATFTPNIGGIQVQVPGPSYGSVTVPIVDRPGQYPVDGGHSVGSFSGSCGPMTGTLTVTTALFDVTGRPTAYTADFAGTCNARAVHYAIRYRSATPYQGIEITQPSGTYVKVGTSSDREYTVTSAGTAPVTFGAATLGGTYAAEYQVLANACEGETLDTGESCTVTVRATPAAKGVRTAHVRLVTDTTRGERLLPLAVQGATAPGLPATPQVYRAVGRARLWWSYSGSDGGAPLTAFTVYRAVNGGGWTLLDTVAAGTPGSYRSYDATEEPGTTYTYAVAAVNSVAEGAKRAGAAARATHSEVVFTHGADDAPWSIHAQTARPDESSVFDARFDVVDDGTDHYTPAVSPDGRTLAYSAPSATGYGLYTRSFAGGAPVLLTALAGHEVDPAWSPDGTTIAFTRQEGDARSVWTIPAIGGTAKKRASTASNPSWQSDSATLVVVDEGSSLRLLRISQAGGRTAISGTINGIDPAVSPDGKWLAFSRYHPTYEHWQLAVVPIAGASAAWYIQGCTDYLAPTWRSDAKRIYYQHVGEYGSLVSSTGFTPTSTSKFSGSEGGGVTNGFADHDPAFRSLGVHLTSAPKVSSRTARISFATTAPVGGTTTCSLDGATPAACTSPWAKAALSAGKHTLVVTHTASGLTSSIAAHTWTVDATAPTVTLTSPGSAVTLKDTVTVTYRASDGAGIGSYDVRYRTSSGGPYSGYVYPADWQRTTAVTRTRPATAGTETCFSVRARDAVGNVSGWSADRCVAVARDDRALSATAAWKRVANADAYLGTLTSAGAAGATLSRASVSAARVYLVVTRCPGCGSVDVSIGDVLFGRVSLHGTAASKVVLALPRRSAPVAGTLRIRAVSTAPVRIDGFALLRT